MGAYLDLLPEVSLESPGAGDIIIERSIRWAVREFCERTQVLRATTSPALDLVADQAEYTLPPVTDRDIVRIVRHGVRWGSDIYPEHVTADQLDRQANLPVHLHTADDSVDLALINAVGTPWRTKTGSPAVVYYQPLPNTVRLVPIPNVSASAYLTVTYSLKPTLASSTVDDIVFSQWHETIVHGALAKLLAIPKKPWSDAALARYKQGLFDYGVANVQNQRMAGFGDNDHAVGRVRAYP